MKQYMKPELTISEIQTTVTILAGSGGVTTGSTVGNNYTETDVTYSRQSNIWDEDE